MVMHLLQKAHFPLVPLLMGQASKHVTYGDHSSSNHHIVSETKLTDDVRETTSKIDL